MNYTILDLFAGCGGLTEGFTTAVHPSARFVPIGAVELDESAAATYAANFGSHVFQGDIADWAGTALPRADVVIGGPPCQGFSTLGKQDPSDVRNKLWSRYAEVVSNVRPAYFVLENVAPFITSSQFVELCRATERGRELEGYTLDESPLVVDASRFGAAQKRKRAVVIGRMKDLPAVHMSALAGGSKTVRDAIGGTEHRVGQIDLPDRTVTLKLANRRLIAAGTYRTSELHLTRTFTQLSIDRFKVIPPGGNRHDLPDHLRAPCWLDHDGSHDVMGRLHWDRPSVTIRTEFWKPEKGRYLHPEANRPITHMEAALLQGFPDDFQWCGTKAAIGRQIGNAVPVELGRAIAVSLLNSLAESGVTPRV